MSTKHTPGPWSIYTSSIAGVWIDPIGIRVDDCGVPERREANARLIAAAPELLDVARLVVEMQAAMEAESSAMPRAYDAPKSVQAIGVVIERAKSAIRCAEGSRPAAPPPAPSSLARDAVLAAYADCHEIVPLNEKSGQARNLDWRYTGTVSGAELVSIFRDAVPDGYNLFGADRLAKLVEYLPPETLYQPAREGSVCVYALLPANAGDVGVGMAGRKCCADEAGRAGREPDGRVWLRFWWD